GSFGHFRTFRGALDFGLANINSGLAFRMNTFRHESDNFRDEKPSKQFAVNPAFTWRLNQKTDVTVNFEFAQNDFQPDAGLPIQFFFDGTAPEIPDVPRERSYQSPFDDSDQNIYRARADFSTKLNENVTIRNKLYFADQDWETTGTLLLGAFPNPPRGDVQVSRALQDLNDRQKYLGNQFDLLFTFQTGSIRHNLVSGLEFTRYDDDFMLKFGVIAPMDLLNPVEITPNILNLLFLQTSTVNAKTIIFAPYFVDQIAFSDKLKFFLGGRYDILDYENERLDVDVINAASLSTINERNYKKLSPMGGVLIAPIENVSIYANAGRAFAPPSTLTRGTPEPEESMQFEVGAKLRFLQGKYNANFALFHLEKDNINIPDTTGVFGQNGDQRSRGIELAINALPFENVHATLSYAFTEAELTAFRERFATQAGFFVIDHSGNTAGFSPKHILNFWTTKEFRNGLGFGFGSRYLSRQFVAADNIFEIEPYLLFNAAIYYQRQGWRWSLNFKNISNRDYEVRGFNGLSVIPADPFTMYSTFQFTL
ncbi:MAG: TonB-dependent receptor, partial [bacterium]